MPPSGPPPASARPIFWVEAEAGALRITPVAESTACLAAARLRARAGAGTRRPDTVLSGMVLLFLRVGRVLKAALTRNGSGELLLRGAPGATLSGLRRLGRTSLRALGLGRLLHGALKARGRRSLQHGRQRDLRQRLGQVVLHQRDGGLRGLPDRRLASPPGLFPGRVRFAD